MDFRNLCQKIDVDSIRAKIPPMPAISMPQIRLPKSMPNLKSRKIFRSSHENVNPAASPKHMRQAAAQSATLAIPPADFIDHTPKRISTISSLMHQTADGGGNQSTYRSACSLDDDYPTPTQFGRCASASASRPISPICTTALNNVESPRNAATITSNNNNVKLSLSERLQKGYKDFSEFRLKHIFAKKTVLRQDNIQVDHYVESYEDDIQREQQEQQRRDRQIADNYRFNFKISRQSTGHSNSLTSNDSPVSKPKEAANARQQAAKSVGDDSGDESGMEASPPTRKPGIAATRFSKVRVPPKSVSEDQNTEGAEDNEEVTRPEPIPSALWSTKINRTSVETSPTAAETVKAEAGKTAANKPKGYKERLRRLTSYVSSHDESGAESATEAASASSKVMSSLRNLGKRNEEEEAETAGRKKRKAPLSPQQSEEQNEPQAKTTENTTITAIKQNFKRLQKSMKLQQTQPTTEDSEDEEAASAKEGTKQTKTGKFTSRMRRFRSRDDIENASPKKEDGAKSPVHVITNKLQTWKKSFKKKPAEADTHTGDETSPEKQKRPSTLIKKLNYIRTRKTTNSTEDLDAEDDEKGKDTSTRKPLKLEEKLVQARQRTLKKVNEKMQHIKFFHKSQENVAKENTRKANNSTDDDDYEEAKSTANVPPRITRRGIHDDYEHDSDQDELEDVANIQQEYSTQKTRAVWTTKPILSDSFDSDIDGECPHVLIHQDNSDLFESTLIIAVTRPASASSSPLISEIPISPKIRDRTPRRYTPASSPKPVEWIPNKEIISGFLEMTPPIKRKMSAEDLLPPVRGHARKLSVDSNSDSDSWMPEGARNIQLSQSVETSRRTSAVGLNRINENEEPWKVHTVFREKLYKTKSIDIFDKSLKIGGAIAAFEDFDDELRDEPVRKIASGNELLSENDSSEEVDAADDDNSSRVTKILAEAAVEDTAKLYVKNASPSCVKQSIKVVENQARQFGNSRESLIANLDETEDEMDRPPSAAPSPPPTIAPPPPPPTIAATPPPLPLRKASMRAGPKPLEEIPPLPPLPVTTPPPLPNKAPPSIPERTPSTSRIAKPLVKTSSLRLAYDEQVKPADVGKVNKLISRFEPQSKITERPRIISRRAQSNDSDDYSDDDDDDRDQDTDQDEEDSDEIIESDHDVVNANAKCKLERDMTLTPTNTPKTHAKDAKDVVTATTIRDAENNTEIQKTCQQDQKSPIIIPRIALNLEKNSNYSRPSSEYGSPLEYPSSLIGSTETTPVPERREQETLNVRRSRRSMTRDDERFFSFDSDEENSYYSISSTGSSRYVVEI